jgi:hypothetical protein
MVSMTDSMHTGIQDRAATAEKRFQKGWNTLRHPPPPLSFISVLITLYNMGRTFSFIREEGRSIQHELSEIRDIENHAVGV